MALIPSPAACQIAQRMDTFLRWSMSAVLVLTSLIRAFSLGCALTRRHQEASRLNAKTSCSTWALVTANYNVSAGFKSDSGQDSHEAGLPNGYVNRKGSSLN
jgi:hypothetical protein